MDRVPTKVIITDLLIACFVHEKALHDSELSDAIRALFLSELYDDKDRYHIVQAVAFKTAMKRGDGRD